jgi:signal transduction histidine kinase
MNGFEQDDTGQINIDIKDDNDFIVLSYKDTGKGIPQEHIEKIFNPFFTTKRGQGGSGLGLHLIYNLITQKFKGSIQCTSEINNGVFFVVRIPKLDS